MTTERTTDNRILHQLTESDCQDKQGTNSIEALLGPPGCAQVFPYLSPGPLDFFGGMKTMNKPHASRNYTQDQLSVHTAAENDRCK